VISRVQIRNFRAVKDVRLDLQKVHALVGENATGKTSVLEAINFATTPYYVSSRIDEQDFNNSDEGPISIGVWFTRDFLIEIPDGFATQHILCNGAGLQVKRREKAAAGRALSEGFVVEHFAIPVTYSDKRTIDSTLVPAGYLEKLPPSVARSDSGWRAARKTTDKPLELSRLRLALTNDLVGFPSVFYFDRMRETEAKIGFNSLLQKIARDLNWRYRHRWNAEATAKSWEEYYKSVIDTVEESKQREIVHPLQVKMKNLLGWDFSNLEISLLNVEQPFNKAFFALRNVVNQVDQSGLGSGISILLAYTLLEIVSGFSKEEIIFLIDEPELHLHPQVQTRLFDHFRQSDHQTVYTTQSDFFVDVSEWRSINRFTGRADIYPRDTVLQEVIANQPIPAHLDEIKRFHRQHCVYFREDNQILFARCCLLVEGPGEKYGLPILARTMGLEFENVTIISCNGKNKIPDYQLLCRVYGIPYFTLFDLDGKPETEPENERIKEWAQGDCVYAFQTSFENLLGIRAEAEHKASNLLLKIDAITTPGEIPEAIVEAMANIVEFTNSGAFASSAAQPRPAGDPVNAGTETAGQTTED